MRRSGRKSVVRKRSVRRSGRKSVVRKRSVRRSTKRTVRKSRRRSSQFKMPKRKRDDMDDLAEKMGGMGVGREHINIDELIDMMGNANVDQERVAREREQRLEARREFDKVIELLDTYGYILRGEIALNADVNEDISDLLKLRKLLQNRRIYFNYGFFEENGVRTNIRVLDDLEAFINGKIVNYMQRRIQSINRGDMRVLRGEDTDAFRKAFVRFDLIKTENMKRYLRSIGVRLEEDRDLEALWD